MIGYETTESTVDRGGSGRDEVFLFHLSRGSQLLVDDEVGQAKEELERALSHQPRDAEGQALLAFVYFRLGHYPRAISLYQSLVDQHPKVVSLRVNLSLALIKSGDASAAREHLRTALELEPEHERAWSYLGVAHWNLGDYSAARDAFLRGGCVSMVQRVDELTQHSNSADAHAGRDSSVVRLAAAKAIERIENVLTPLSIARSNRPLHHGSWRVTEPGAGASSARTEKSSESVLPTSLQQCISSWRPRLERGPFAVLPSGQLWIRSRGPIYGRRVGMSFFSGAAADDVPDERTLHNTFTRFEPCGAHLEAAYEASELRFLLLQLAADSLIIREDHVCCFEAQLSIDRPTDAFFRGMVRFHGYGAVALLAARLPTSLQIAAGDRITVRAASLIGWVGQIQSSTSSEAYDSTRVEEQSSPVYPRSVLSSVSTRGGASTPGSSWEEVWDRAALPARPPSASATEVTLCGRGVILLG